MVVLKRPLLALVITTALIGAACGHDHDSGGGDDVHNAEGSVPGSSANASEVAREVAVNASDELSFTPSSLDIDAGEIVTFVVHNQGKTDHEFVLGDEEYQNTHEADMASGHHMMDTDNAVTIGPGETKELTWEFTEVGKILYGCHEPGHYDGGMVGTIDVG